MIVPQDMLEEGSDTSYTARKVSRSDNDPLKEEVSSPLFPPLSQGEVAGYKKVGVISQEEFDSQRGAEERVEGEPPVDSDMFFALDLPDGKPVHPVANTTPTISITTSVPLKPPPPPVSSRKEGERVGGGGREGRESSPSKQRAQPMAGAAGTAMAGKGKSRSEKRARFYPVPNKQEAPPQVQYPGVWQGAESFGQRGRLGVCACTFVFSMVILKGFVVHSYVSVHSSHQ